MTDSSEIWTGEAALYHQTRPAPPPVLPDLLRQLIHTARPALVVDLGSGTGLSSMIWGARAERVIGIEPNADMRAQATRNIENHAHATRIEYRAGLAHRTGLADSSADIVTCSQAFHWMEPISTLAEIARILRPGGLFAAYDYNWPPAINWELEHVFQGVDERFDQLAQERGVTQEVQRWSKDQHLDRMRASGRFRFTRELLLHHVERGDATRFIGLVLSGGYGREIKQGNVSEQEVGFDRLRQAALEHIGPEPIPWYFSYQVRMGVK